MMKTYPLLSLPFWFCVLLSTGAQAEEGTIAVWPSGESPQLASEPPSPAQTFTMRPSVLSSRFSPYGAGEQTTGVFIACVLLPFNIIVPDCDITLNWQVDNGSGGHLHHTNRPPGRFDTENGASGGSVDPGPPGSVTDNSGADGFLGVTYAAPEASGLTRITVSGIGTVDGETVFFGPNEFTIGVQFGGLSRPAIAGLNPLTASNMHGNNNGHTDSGTAAALQNLVQFFSDKLQVPNQPPVQAPDVTLTAASLPQGGLFDFRNEWAPPHVSHRFGNDVDIRIRTFNDAQRKALAEAVRDAGFSLPVRAESPADPAATHWHARH